MMRMNKDRRTAILMITPSIILLGVFIYGFIAQTLYNSLTDWGDPKKPSLAEHVQISFIGLKNYQDLFSSLLNYRFRVDLINTIFFTVLFLVACLGLGLLMAILLDQKIRGEAIFRTIFLFPMALSFVVTGTVWRWLFAPNGGLNVLPTLIGLQPLTLQWFTDTGRIASFSWHDVLVFLSLISVLAMLYFVLTAFLHRSARTALAIVILGLLGGLFFAASTNLSAAVAREKHGLNTAMLAIVIAATWQMAGYTMAIYLAGLRGIPDELREAARVDGCTEFQVYRFVVLPMLQPITLSAAIILGHISLKIFDLIYVMAGGNLLQVDVPGINMYLTAFQANNFSLGSAIAIIMLILVALIIVPYLYTSLRGEPSS